MDLNASLVGLTSHFPSSVELFSLPWWAWIAAAVALFLFAVVVIKLVKKILVNTVLGLAALLLVNFFGSGYGVTIPINLVTLAVSALLGLAGVGALILLALFGVKV
ncbi:MAG: pro-sigmaK processing inhibitor BofA family protein [Candidatus Norongarragalinales archaeon]